MVPRHLGKIENIGARPHIRAAGEDPTPAVSFSTLAVGEPLPLKPRLGKICDRCKGGRQNASSGPNPDPVNNLREHFELLTTKTKRRPVLLT
jgi:hypothetical protein